MESRKKILWKTCSNRYDWRNLEKASSWLKWLNSKGMIGDVEWEDISEKGRQSLPGPQPYFSFLPKIFPIIDKLDILLTIEFGGSKPTPWSVFIALFEYDPVTGVQGLNVMSLELEINSSFSETLEDCWAYFRNDQSSESTDYSVLHPYEHYQFLKERLYAKPITNIAQFDGVYWANFIAEPFWSEFEHNKILPELSDFIVLEDEKGGLFFRLKEYPEGDSFAERKLPFSKVTKLFKRSMKPESRWL